MKVVLIACSSQKLDHAAPARELYTSQLFTKALAYARSQVRDDRIFVMSAMHGLVSLDRILTPYDRELKKMPKRQRTWWGINLVDSLRERVSAMPNDPITPDHTVVLLGGADYNVPVRSALARIAWKYEEPLEGLNIGERLQWLKKHAPAPPVVAAPEPELPIGRRASPPVFKPTEPYVRQTSSTLHGWRIQVFDPTISDENAVLEETSVKKYTQAQKLRLLSIYKHRKENRNAETNH